MGNTIDGRTGWMVGEAWTNTMIASLRQQRPATGSVPNMKSHHSVKQISNTGHDTSLATVYEMSLFDWSIQHRCMTHVAAATRNAVDNADNNRGHEETA